MMIQYRKKQSRDGFASMSIVLPPSLHYTRQECVVFSIYTSLFIACIFTFIKKSSYCTLFQKTIKDKQNTRFMDHVNDIFQDVASIACMLKRDSLLSMNSECERKVFFLSVLPNWQLVCLIRASINVSKRLHSMLCCISDYRKQYIVGARSNPTKVMI